MFHFPTGGSRFRPSIEDVLEVTRVEFDLEVDNNIWKPRLKEAREKWRRIQTASVVRDCPDEALRVLIDDFNMPMPVGWTCPEPDIAKLLRN